MWYVASNRCFEVRSRSRGDNRWQKILLYLRQQHQLASLSTSKHLVPLFFIPTGHCSFFNSRKMLLSSTLLRVSAHLAVMITLWLTPSLFKNLLNKKHLIMQNQISAFEYCVWKHRSCCCEKGACWCWIEHGKNWESSTVHSLFPCFCMRIDSKFAIHSA